MKKTILYNVKMFGDADPVIYESTDETLPVVEKAVRYPVNVFLEKTLQSGDEVKAVFIAKQDEGEAYKSNLEKCRQEFIQMAEITGINYETAEVLTPFHESYEVHSRLLMDLVDEINENADLIVDMTYGPKDLVVVLFAALNIADKFLGCEIQNIMYGKADRKNGEIVSTSICEMSPLYYLNSVVNVMDARNPEDAKAALKVLLQL